MKLPVSGSNRRQRPASSGVLTAATALAVAAGTVVTTGTVLTTGAAVVAVGFPYLSVREVSQASDVAARNPNAALSR